MFSAVAARSFLIPLRASEIGADRFQIGLFFTIVTFSAAALSLPAGMLADRLGRRLMLVVSVLAGGVSQVGLALSSSVELYYFWQAVAGIGGAGAQAALWTAVADLEHGPRLGRAMGWLTLSFQMGFLVGPAIAGLALHSLTVQEDLVATSALYGVSLVGLISVGRATVRHMNPIRPVVQLLRQPGFAQASLSLLGATLLWGTLQGYLTIFAKEALRLPAFQIGLLIALQAAANGLSRVPAGRLVDRSGERRWLTAVGIIGFAAAVAVLPHLQGFWLPALVLVVPMPLLALAFIGVSVAFTNLATAESRGVAMGLYGMILFLGLGTGPLIFGPIMQNAGYVAGFTACAVVATAITLGVTIVGMEPVRSFFRRRAVKPAPPANDRLS
jgi:MFS family permease